MRSSTFEEQIVTLEKRCLYEVNILEHNESPWRSFREDSRILRPDVAETIERAFDCGGFVAGGCARWLRSSGKVNAIKRGTYIHEGGDIDIFFRTLDGWRTFLEQYTEQDLGWPKVVLSSGKLAANLTFQGGARKNPSKFSDPPIVQAICCVTGTPQKILQSFDFHNSMVAFDREKTWVVEDWDEIERERTLKVAWWGSRSISYRVSKYMMKYGYHKLVNASSAMFDQLVEGTNSMTDKQKYITRAKWMESLHFDVCDLETKLLILASTAQGIETNDLFTLTKNRIAHVWVGSYENAIHNLLERQKKANELERNTYSDPPGFSAEEYCWAV